MSEKLLRYKFADVGLRIGGLLQSAYAIATADGEKAEYFFDLAKQFFASEPIILATIGGFYCVGGLMDTIKQNDKSNNLENKL